MALADPLSVTINAVTTPLPKTFGQGDESAYTSADGLIKVSVGHTIVKQGRARRVLRIDHSKLSPDAFKPTENVKVNMACYVVFDIPPSGYSNSEVLQVYTGFKTLYTASSDAVITKILGGES